jgi:hypothetical protein
MPFVAGEVTGRPKGSEGKDTKRVREAIAAITEGGITNLNECFDEIRTSNPAKFVELYLRLLEYTMPKLRSIDNNIDMSDSLIQKITVEVANGKRAEDTSNNSIPE